MAGRYRYDKKYTIHYIRKKRKTIREGYVLIVMAALMVVFVVFLATGDSALARRIRTAFADDPVPSEASGESLPKRQEPEVPAADERRSEEETETETEEVIYEIDAASQEDKETISEDDWRRYEVVRPYKNLGIVIKVHNYLNMRTKPEVDAEVCGVIFPNCGVDILEHTESGWYKIESGGTTGYVSDRFIETGEKAIALAMTHCRYMAESIEDHVFVMREPDYDSDIITYTVQGDFFDCLSEDDEWVEIEIAEGLGGFVPRESVRTTYRLEQAIAYTDAQGASQLRRDIINTAFQYYGGKYVFGGTSLVTGIDCSAFTQAIFRKNGIELTRNSWSQAMEGKHIDEKDYRPGDLLFYGASHKDGVGHVAIYIGNGKIIHAASERKGICVSDFKVLPILEARNVIGD